MSREVLEGWLESQIDAVADINPDSLRSNTSTDFRIKYIDVATVDGPSTMSEPRSMNFGDAPSRARKRVKRGDILVSTVRPYLRSFCQVLSSEPNLVASTAFAVLRPKPMVNGDFLYQHVLWERFVEHLTPRMKGSNYPAVTAGDVGAYTFLLPPLREQRRIAEILSSVDEAIAATRAVIEQARKVKQGVLERLLSKGIGHTRFTQTEIGEIPEGWEVVRVSDVAASIDSGWSPDCEKVAASEGEWGILKTSAVVWDGYQPHENKKLPHSLAPRPEIEVRAGDVLITRAGPVDRTGVVALVKNTQQKLMLSDKIIRIQTNADQCMPSFLSLWLSSPLAQNEIIKKKSGMAQSQTNISQKALRELFVSLPPLDEQTKIADAVQSVDDGISAESAKLDALVVAKSALMSDLLTGRKRVTDALPMAAE